MSLYSYSAEASKRSDLPNTNGSLSASVSPTAIKEANEAVTRERASGEGVTLSFNLYAAAAIGKYASLHGNQAATRHFSKQLGVIFSSARGILANLRHARAHVQ